MSSLRSASCTDDTALSPQQGAVHCDEDCSVNVQSAACILAVAWLVQPSTKQLQHNMWLPVTEGGGEWWLVVVVCCCSAVI